MTALRVAFSRLWTVFAGPRRQRELDEEMATHLEMLAEEHVRAGLSRDEARAAARRSFGGVERTKEACRDQRGWPFVDSVIQDIRFAFRTFAKDRRLLIGAVMALGLGIGVNNMVFTFVNTIVFRELPLQNPQQLVGFNSRPSRGRTLGLSYPDFRDVLGQSQSFKYVVARTGNVMNVGDNDHAPERFRGGYVSPNVFLMYSITPVRGRVLRAEDDVPGAAPVVVISDRVWASRYENDPNILGRTIRVNGVVSAIVGIAPAAFKSPLMNDQVWQPLHMFPGLDASERDARTLSVDGRLEADVPLEEAQAELAAISARLEHEYPDTNRDVVLAIEPLAQIYKGVTAPVLLTMMAMVAVVLLIACANVANLLLARSADRSREIAIRASLGASRSRLVRQLLIESLVLGCAGGLLGLVFSVYLVKMFSVAFAGREIGGNESFMPFWVDLSMNWRVFAYLAMLSLATSIVFGFAPALHLSKVRLHDAVREGGRGVGVGIRARRWTQTLVIGELALALVLLSAAGLLVHSVFEGYKASRAFDTSSLMTMRFTLPGPAYSSAAARQALFQRLEGRLDSNPSIASASLATNIPFIPGGSRRDVSAGHNPFPVDAEAPSAMYLLTDTRYFRTLGVSLLRGRDFNDLDGVAGQDAVIVNQRFATTFFPEVDPVGRRIQLRNPAERGASPSLYTIVGVAPTIPQFTIPNAPGKPPDSVVYSPLQREESPAFTVSLIARSRSADTNVVDAARQELRGLDPDVPLYFVRSMDDAAGEMQFQTQGVLRLFGFFAVIAFVLAAVGLYAVTAHAVTQRTTEIGVRMALGASRSGVLWLFLRSTLVQVALGVTLGLAGALAAGRVMQGMLVQTSPRDAVTLIAAAMLLVIVSLVGALVPARRAAGLDPATTLRYE